MKRYGYHSLPLLLILASSATLQADTITLDFEGFPDSTILTNQYSGVTFTNAQILTAGISLNEFEFPPHSGTNVVSDNGGPISITFDSPVLSFAGYFTYLSPVTLTAFDNGNNTVATAHSLFSNNVACLAGPPCSANPGSSPNELIQLNTPSGISRLTIRGDPAGASFTLDDAAQMSLQPSGAPEPGTIFLTVIGAAALSMLRRKLRFL